MEHTGATDIRVEGTQRNCGLESRQLGAIEDSNTIMPCLKGL